MHILVKNLLLLFVVAFANCDSKKVGENLNSMEIDKRIVGGVDVQDEDILFLVSLRYFNSHICGGAIINNLTILTAAHCTKNRFISDLSIRAGSPNISGPDGQFIGIANIYTPEPTHDRIYSDDLSIIKLNKPLIFNDQVQPIKLPKQDNDLPKVGDIGLVYGWGLDNFIGNLSFRAKKVGIPVISLEQCQEAYLNRNVSIFENEFCADDAIEGQKDSCQGDSGGPFVVDDELVGIVSCGMGCGNPGSPGIYTKLVMHRDFINIYQ